MDLKNICIVLGEDTHLHPNHHSGHYSGHHSGEIIGSLQSTPFGKSHANASADAHQKDAYPLEPTPKTAFGHQTATAVAISNKSPMIDLSLFRINLSHNILYAKNKKRKKKIKKRKKKIKTTKNKRATACKTGKNTENISKSGRGMDETEE